MQVHKGYMKYVDEKGNEHLLLPRTTAALVEGLDKTKAGFIYPLASESVPMGFLLCNGAEYDREEYPELFAAIGTIYGNGDGVTTFNVPNLQTRVPVGAGGDYALGNTGGAAEHTLTIDEMPEHNHHIEVTHTDSGNTNAGDSVKYNGHLASYAGTRLTRAAGGSQPHNNMQPYTVVNYIIATGKGTAVSVKDIVLGAQAIPLEVQYGGTGATSGLDACKNIKALPAIESKEHPGCYYRSVSGEKEWINPPMVAGIEYRTTERADDDPLYVKEIYCGALTDQMQVELPASIIYRWSGWTSNGTVFGDHTENENMKISVQFLGSTKKALFRLGTEVAVASPVGYLQVWYKKG